MDALDTCLGQWLKAALDSPHTDPKFEACFYGGACDQDPPTCFIANDPVCKVAKYVHVSGKH